MDKKNLNYLRKRTTFNKEIVKHRIFYVITVPKIKT
jgi:hypothetical protein